MSQLKVSEFKVEIKLFGSFKVTSASGVDLTPRSKKAIGLLAILALTPGFSRSRKWLQDQLWSDRGPEQGAASLRQTLLELRKMASGGPPFLIADRGQLALNCDLIQVDVSNPGNQDLLEGLDVRDPQFEEWLRTTRSTFRQTAKEPSIEPSVASGCNAPLVRMVNNQEDPTATVLAAGVGSLITRSISDGVPARVLSTHSNDPNAIVDLEVTTSVLEKGRILHIQIDSPSFGAHVWSETIELLETPIKTRESLEILRGINTSANIARDWLQKNIVTGNDDSVIYAKAVGLTMSFQLPALKEARQLFEMAYQLKPRGLFLAWQAYVMSFLVAEGMNEDAIQLSEQAKCLIDQALAAEPNNSLVLSLCAHCETMIFMAHHSAYELAKRSVEINPTNAFAWICLAITECHLGRTDHGLLYSRRARAITGSSPMRPHIDLLSCTVAVLAGHVEEALHYGEAVHSRLPHLIAPLRFLTAIYYHQKNDSRIEATLKKIQKLEPGFSIEQFHDLDYPVESLRKSGLITSVPRS